MVGRAAGTGIDVSASHADPCWIAFMMPSVQAWSGTFYAPDQLAMALRDADIEYLSLQPGDFRARLSAIQLGPISLQIAQDGPHISRGAIASRPTMLLPLGGVADGVRVNGHRMRAENAILLGEQAGLHVIVPGRQRWAALALGADALPALGLEGMHVAGRDFAVRPQLLARARGMQSLLMEIEQMAILDPGRFAAGSVTAAICESLCCQVSAGMRADAGLARPGRAVRRRIALVAMAEEFAASEKGRPIYTHDLCAALGVAPRTLHAAFSAVFGMSPHRYLRIRRLNQAREALRQSAEGQGLVKSVALEHGFWHMGRFAQEYRALFGESPSSTMRTTQLVNA